jgi:hypothetical protein
MAEDALGVIGAGFVETVHVELAYETVDLVVAEETREDDLLEFEHVFDDELHAGGRPVYDLVELVVVLSGVGGTLRI